MSVIAVVPMLNSIYLALVFSYIYTQANFLRFNSHMYEGKRKTVCPWYFRSWSIAYIFSYGLWCAITCPNSFINLYRMVQNHCLLQWQYFQEYLALIFFTIQFFKLLGFICSWHSPGVLCAWNISTAFDKNPFLPPACTIINRWEEDRDCTMPNCSSLFQHFPKVNVLLTHVKCP